ncbi:MAG: hypothetical protein IJD30_05685 [Clostridia bacterium]|nr:hypothetical protein [Clostridia bacterium]
MKQVSNSRKKLILKIISVFAAAIIWIFITYTENPQTDVTLNAVDISLSGESYLKDNGLMVTEKNSIPDASIVIRGKRRDLIGVMGNVTASIDVSRINKPGTYNLKPSFDIPSNAVYIAKMNTASVTVTVENIEKRTIDVKIVQKNADKNKLYVVESVPQTATVSISGTLSDIQDISYACAYVDVGTMSQNNDAEYSVVFEDINGAEILPINDFSSDITSVMVTNTVYDKITLDIELDIPSRVSDKYAVELVGQTTKKVDAGIKDKSAADITTITNIMNFDGISLDTTNYTLTLDVPKGLYIPPENQKVEVELEVFEREERTLSVPITVTNADKATYLLDSDTVKVRVSGPKDKLTPENLSATLDLKNTSYKPGEITLPVQIKAKYPDITVLTKKVNIKVNIKETE